jgi:hypothetical protein
LQLQRMSLVGPNLTHIGRENGTRCFPHFRD